MKSDYDFSKAVRGKFADRIPADAVFVQFDPDVSELLAGPGDFAARLRSLARHRRGKGRRRRIVRSVALSPEQYRALKPLLDRFGARRVGGDMRGMESPPRQRRAG